MTKISCSQIRDLRFELCLQQKLMSVFGIIIKNNHHGVDTIGWFFFFLNKKNLDFDNYQVYVLHYKKPEHNL